MTETIHSYRLACLFAEIGRLRSRSERDTHESAHTKYSVQFLQDQIGDATAARLVELHHADTLVPESEIPEELRRGAYVVMAASRLASAHTAEAGAESKASRLHSVFDAVSDTDITETYPLSPLAIDRETLFPKPADEHTHSVRAGYERLWSELTTAVESADQYETLVHLTEKHTWCVPAFPDTPDRPLYDQLRTTAAIGDALYQSSLSVSALRSIAAGEAIDQSCFALLKGDLSGIQSFLHRMKEPDEAQESSAKRLRGRSTQLWLLTESLSRLFVGQFDLPCTSVLWSGGGQFYALVPPLAEAGSNDQIEAFERAVNTELFDRFGGELSVVVGRANARDSADSFERLFKAVAHDTEKRKLKKGSSIASDLDTPILDDPTHESRTKPCPGCGGEKPHDEDRCSECRTQEALGGALPEAAYLCLDRSPHPTEERKDEFQFGRELPDGPLRWRFVSSPQPADRLYSVNLTERPDGTDAWGFVFAGTTVPYGEAIGRVWSFTEQAALARSEASFTHVVAMDIDDLGRTIADAMDEGPTRLAALGRTLSLFFEGYLNELAGESSYVCESPDICSDCYDRIETMTGRSVEHRYDEEEETTYYRPTAETSTLHDDCIERVSPIYIGFSGGDDMICVGPWDEAVTFARRVREELTAYCSETLTISAGFLRMKPKQPIGRAIEQAERQLESAKAVSNGSQTKNAASIFGETRAWRAGEQPGMNDLLDLGQRLETFIKNEQLSRSHLHAFLEIGTEGTAVGVQKEWKIKYLLSKNTNEQAMNELDSDLPRALQWITVPVGWASLATR